MNITCPHCDSEHVIRVIHTSQASQHNLAASASFASVGVALSKTLPVSPLMGGIAGMVVGGLIHSLFDSGPAPQSTSRCFLCQTCGQLFY
ncbi:hypothetical protein KTH71_06530 [Acinetobacter sp. WU_MDCI_Axc73]|nr:hypothetical protein [Acinetobacter sp. WU_MDCI_Axc73]